MKNFDENSKNLSEENILVDSTNFKIDQWKTPFLFETWNWEGDESILPFKWIKLAKLSPIGINFTEEKLKEFMKTHYYNNKNFDKKSFFFITHRSDTAGCVYLNYCKKENTFVIEFLIVNDKKYQNKGIELALINLAIKRAKELNDDPIIKIKKSATNINIKEVFNSMGLLLK